VTSSSAPQRLLQLFDGGQIKMVRRLVEDQNVGAASLQKRKSGAGPFTGRQFVDLAFDVVGAQAELGEQGSHIGGRPRWHPLLEPVDETAGAGEVRTSLIDLADGHIGAQTSPALIGFSTAE
jgi:hypothetical protein